MDKKEIKESKFYKTVSKVWDNKFGKAVSKVWNNKFFSIVFLTICVFLMIPINLSKKNRMYKVLGLFFKYLFKNKKYYLIEER